MNNFPWYKQFESAFIKHQRLITIIVFLLAIVASSWSLLLPNLGRGHDTNHETRIYEMAAGLKQGTFPVIWSQNLAYGYGMPLFEFYAPLPYFVGALFYMIGLNLTYSVEVMILIASITALIGSYLLAKELLDDHWAAVLAAVVITLAPYRAVDLYIRAAISEAWAISWLIFVFWGACLIIKKQPWGWLVMSVSFAGLILSHNLTALLAVPFIALFSIVYLLLQKRSLTVTVHTVVQLFLTALLGAGLAAFYFIPAFVEKSFTQLDLFTLSSYFNISQHFLYIRQLIKPWGEWEYGGFGWGPDDEMSFFLGYSQLVIFGVATLQLIPLFVKQIKSKKINSVFILQLALLAFTGLALLLTLQKTYSLWLLIDVTKYFQFPWRLIAVALVLAGLLAGTTYTLFHKRFKKIYLVAMLLLTLCINTRYFNSEKQLVKI